MIRWIVHKYFNWFPTPEERTDFALFSLTITLTLLWWFMIVTEAFHLNPSGIVISGEATVIWQLVLGYYTIRKSMARWHKTELNGALWGRTFGVLTIIGGFSLYAVHMYFPHVTIPEQLHYGLEGVATNIFGWHTFKTYRANQTNGSETNGKDAQNKPPIQSPGNPDK